MAGVLTEAAVYPIEDPEDDRVHLVRPETIRHLDNGMVEATTLCGMKVVGYLRRGGASRVTCECCQERQIDG
jgi:hypothetical protein